MPARENSSTTPRTAGNNNPMDVSIKSVRTDTALQPTIA